MPALNKIQIIGHLGKDPRTAYFPSGDLYATFSVAVTDKWKSKEGEQKSSTQWFQVQATRRLAEICRDYLHKGSLVYIEGKMTSREYEEEGVKKTFWEIKVLSLQMLDRKEGNGDSRSIPESMEGAEIPAEDDIPF